MKNKGEMIGNVYDDGTIILPDGTKARPLNPSDEPYWIQKKFESYFKENRDAFLRLANAMYRAAEFMDRAADVINNNSNIMNQNLEGRRI